MKERYPLKASIKRIGIISKQKRPEPIEILKEILGLLESSGIEVFLDDETGKKIGLKGLPKEEIPGRSDLIIVLGGDGTLLSVARLVAEKEVPILGVNLGTLGFLTEVSRYELKEALRRIIDGEFSLEKRLMLRAELIRDGESIAVHHLLNDVVINKGALARIIDLETFIDSNLVTLFKADGLIVSSPTGSTAYNLSAGGPILYPSLECMVLTPICPHTLTNRPIVIPGTSRVEVRLKSETQDVYLTLDGQIGIPLKRNDRVVITKASFKTSLVIPPERNYFEILRTKLGWGGYPGIER